MKNIFFTATIVMCFSLSVNAEELRVAVAANFYSTLAIIKKEFEKAYSDKLVIIKGSTGKLYAQIKHGAPYDVYMAADIKRPYLLEQQQKILENSRYTYASGLLVLWSNENKSNVLDKLKKGDFNKLAIANPKIAPYGQAAVETLSALGIQDKVKRKMVYGENVAQTFQFVQSGSIQLGFVALSYVKPYSSNYWKVPESMYTPLKQQMVILKNSKKKPAAKRFMIFMKSKNIKQIIRQQGYHL